MLISGGFMKIKISELRKLIRESIIQENVYVKGEKSLDAQIDRYFIEFEKDAKKDNELNVEQFANSVVRLIKNFDRMLESRSSITRRANWYLSKVYNDDVVADFLSIMKTGHGISPGETKREVEDEQFIPPNAERGMPSQ